MNVELVLDETEKFLQSNKETIPVTVLHYLENVIKQDRDYIRLVQQWSEKKIKPV